MANVEQTESNTNFWQHDEFMKYLFISLGALVLSWTFYGFHRTFYIMNFTGTIVSGLFLAAIYLAFAIGLNLTYKLLGFANFAHAEYFVVGAYIGVTWSNLLEEGVKTYHYLIVIVIAFFVSGLLAMLGDILIFKPLRAQNANPETLMITSIGWGIFIRNILSIFFGGDSSYFTVPHITVPIPTIWFGRPGGVTPFNMFFGTTFKADLDVLFAIVTSIGLVVGLLIFMDTTKVGKALKATSDNRDLAESSGIDTEKMILLTWFIGGGLAGVAGVIFVAKTPVIPYSGFLYLLPAFAVVVLGGVGSIRGSILAALIIGFVEDLSKMYLSGQVKINQEYFNFAVDRPGLTAYSIVAPFLILIVVIFYRPTGIFGDE